MPKVLPSSWDVPEIFRARLGDQAGRQRAMTHGGHLLLILHDVPDPNRPDERDAAIFWRHPDRNWKGAGAGEGGLPALRALLANYKKMLHDLELRVESASRASDYFEVLKFAVPTLRSARNLHHTLQEAREALSDEPLLISFRDRAGDIERAAELLHADAKSGLDYTVARRAEEQADLSAKIAESGHRLNLLAALFFPITALGTMLGMNIQHGLENAGAPFLFWFVLAAAFAVGFMVRSSLNVTSR
jgi:hypothetical protein